MKYVCLIALFLLLYSQAIFSQHETRQNDSLFNPTPAGDQLQRRSDSLKRLIDQSPDDTLKVLRLFLLSGIQATDTPHVTFTFANQAKLLAEKLQYKRGLARAFNAIGNIYQVKKDYATAIVYYLKALDAGEKYTYHTDEDDFYPPALNLCFYLGDYPNAMKIASRGLARAEKENDQKKIARYNNLFGYIYYKQGNLTASKTYYGQYIAMTGRMKDSLMIAHAFNEASEVFMAEKNYSQALSFLLQSLTICEQLVKGNRPLYSTTIGAGAQILLANALYKTGRVYKLLGNYNKALYYALEAVNYTTRVSCNTYEVAGYYISTGDIYKELKEYQKAIGLLHYGLMLSKDIRHRENIRDAYDYLAQTYALQKQFDSAYFFYRLFIELKDSIVNNETGRKIAEIQARYDVEKRDKEIVRQHLIRNIITGTFVFLLLTFFLLYNRYRLKQKNRYQQQLNRQQNEMFNTIINIQDRERKRIAQDIHDSLGSALSAAKLQLSGIEESKDSLTTEQQERYLAALALLDEAAVEVRNISHNIMPATLSRLGLVAALQNLFDTISSYRNLRFQFATHGFEARLDEETEISIYRMVLELVNNAVKHAQAGKVTVQLVRHPHHINITVEDNGVGFDPKQLPRSGGIGISNILSRTEFLKGTMDIDSGQHNGTTVIIDIPYPIPNVKK